MECVGIGLTYTLEQRDRIGILRSKDPQLIYFLLAFVNFLLKRISF